MTQKFLREHHTEVYNYLVPLKYFESYIILVLIVYSPHQPCPLHTESRQMDKGCRLPTASLEKKRRGADLV